MINERLDASFDCVQTGLIELLYNVYLDENVNKLLRIF
ncbi:hypothetical protein BH18THE1_BH18THE1_10090 [soil metagenome]